MSFVQEQGWDPRQQGKWKFPKKTPEIQSQTFSREAFQSAFENFEASFDRQSDNDWFDQVLWIKEHGPVLRDMLASSSEHFAAMDAAIKRGSTSTVFEIAQRVLREAE